MIRVSCTVGPTCAHDSGSFGSLLNCYLMKYKTQNTNSPQLTLPSGDSDRGNFSGIPGNGNSQKFLVIPFCVSRYRIPEIPNVLSSFPSWHSKALRKTQMGVGSNAIFTLVVFSGTGNSKEFVWPNVMNPNATFHASLWQLFKVAKATFPLWSQAYRET